MAARRQNAAAQRDSGQIETIRWGVRSVGLTAAWQLSGPVLCCVVMLGSFVSRFRVLMLLLAFALGMAGQIVSTAAMAAQMQPVTSVGMASDDPCPGCPGDQHGGMMTSCSVIGCWTAPALPVQSATLGPSPQVAFVVPSDVVIAGIGTSPDPHPPRAILHT